MAELRFDYLLPAPDHGSATFVTDYGLRGGRLLVGGAVVLEATSRADLERGVRCTFGSPEHLFEVRSASAYDVRLWLDGVEAARGDAARAARRAAWIHAGLALVASACGFAASWVYVVRARAAVDPWAMKMALHMAAWHLLLTLTLFPAAAWGGRAGVGAVRLTSLVFALIHVGIAASNTGAEAASGPIAALNAASGLAFLATAILRPPRR
jgi:hypothetical protein